MVMMYNIRSGNSIVFPISHHLRDIRKINMILKYLTLKMKAKVKEEKTEHAQFD